MGLPRQEYWSGLPFPSPGALPNPGIKSMSPDSTALADRFFTLEAYHSICHYLKMILNLFMCLFYIIPV